MKMQNEVNILDLIVKYLAGTADSDDTAQLKEWIESSGENKQYFEQVRNIWDASDKRADQSNININGALEKVTVRVQKVSLRSTFWNQWQKIAAILFFPLAISTLLLIYLNSINRPAENKLVYNEVHAAFGTRSSLLLADSTQVWLNSGSSLKYPVRFGNRNRQVFLKGEAYFEVKSDLSKPFIVETSTLKVRATGTKFNVQEYDSNPVSEVVLVSGKVFVNEAGNNKDPKLISELYPGQLLLYNKRTRIKSVSNEETYKFIAWKDGKLIFRNDPLHEVLSNIGRIFNADIELQGDELQNYRYHATFQEESLEEILKLLKLSAPISYFEVKRNLLPDGSFPKKRVIISRANKVINNKSYSIN